MAKPGFAPDHVDAVLLIRRVAVLGNTWQLPE
jgi:hypothetical protein